MLGRVGQVAGHVEHGFNGGVNPAGEGNVRHGL
jgi:hypothetical protein